jgi:hypothetical protein
VPFPMTVSAPDLAPTCGPCETVGFGTPVMLKPLSAGHHVLVLHDQVLRTGDDGLTPVRDDHGRLIWDPATLTVDVTVA